MPRRHPIPRTWLITDERLGEELWRALRRLPRGSGVVVRHYRSTPAERRALARRIARAVGPETLVLGAGISGRDGGHNRVRRAGLTSRSVHDAREVRAAIRERADVVFVSPVYPTASHPGAATLGPRGLLRLARLLPMPVIALGGMDARRYAPLRRRGIHGWAAIDAWRQKRKAVPT